MKLTDAHVAVTGATGFLGRHLVEVLLARGARVVGVVRNPERGADLAALGVELRRADLADRDALATALDGVDALISNAALVSLGAATPADLVRTNVEGTANVLAAAKRAGVERLVQVSSCAAYRAPMLSVTSERHGEDWPLRDDGDRVTRFNAYGYSKAMAERLAWTHAERTGLQLTTLRPTTVFGVGDPNFLPTLRRLMSLPICPFPVGARISLVHAGDVAEAAALALEQPRTAAGRAYNMGGDETTLWELVRMWRALGQRAPALLLPVPCPLSIPWSSERAGLELGWRRRPLEVALRATLDREAASGRLAA